MTEEGSRFLKREFCIDKKKAWDNATKYNEMIDGYKKNEIITWNDNNIPIFCINKKKLIVKNLRELGFI